MNLRDSFNEGTFHEHLESQPFNDLFLKYEKVITELSRKSKTFAYWSMYMKMAGRKCFNCHSTRWSANNVLIQNHNLFNFAEILLLNTYWKHILLLFSKILLMFVGATREVDWELHLSTFRLMIPWFFLCVKLNYARYGSAYWLEMNALETTHPGLLYLATQKKIVSIWNGYHYVELL